MLWRAKHNETEAAWRERTAKLRSHINPSSDTYAAAGPAFATMTKVLNTTPDTEQYVLIHNSKGSVRLHCRRTVLAILFASYDANMTDAEFANVQQCMHIK